MNGELVNKALVIVGNPNILVNIVSQRVRQLNSGMGGSSRPLVICDEKMGIADIALLEIIEGKMGWTIPELAPPVRKKRRIRR
jgi:DNA-directed RNA polymerase subunit omega